MKRNQSVKVIKNNKLERERISIENISDHNKPPLSSTMVNNNKLESIEEITS